MFVFVVDFLCNTTFASVVTLIFVKNCLARFVASHIKGVVGHFNKPVT